MSVQNAEIWELKDLGVFPSLDDLWAAHPEGGQEGDYAYIGASREVGTKYRWNKYFRVWLDASSLLPPSPEQSAGVRSYIIDGDLYITGNLRIGENSHVENNLNVDGEINGTVPGGGGATTLGELSDVSASNPSNKDLLSFNSGTGKWTKTAMSSLVSLVNGSGSSTLTVNGTSASFYTKAQVDGLISGIRGFEPVVVPSRPTASADTMFKLYLVPSSNPQTGNVKDEYITVRSGSSPNYTYSWEMIGSTSVDVSGYIPKVPGATNGNIATFGSNGGLVDSGHKHADYVTVDGTQTVSGAKTFSSRITGSNGMSITGGGLSMGQNGYVDIGPARLEYDASTGAIHVTTNQTGNNAPTIGLYTDGCNSAGGVGTNGGGGYGVESITSNQDGTVEFHFSGGDTTTINLNHEHPQYPKKVVCTQAEYNALATKDSDTLYLIPAT